MTRSGLLEPHSRSLLRCRDLATAVHRLFITWANEKGKEQSRGGWTDVKMTRARPGSCVARRRRHTLKTALDLMGGQARPTACSWRGLTH